MQFFISQCGWVVLHMFLWFSNFRWWIGTDNTASSIDNAKSEISGPILNGSLEILACDINFIHCHCCDNCNTLICVHNIHNITFSLGSPNTTHQNRFIESLLSVIWIILYYCSHLKISDKSFLEVGCFWNGQSEINLHNPVIQNIHVVRVIFKLVLINKCTIISKIDYWYHNHTEK